MWSVSHDHARFPETLSDPIWLSITTCIGCVVYILVIELLHN